MVKPLPVTPCPVPARTRYALARAVENLSDWHQRRRQAIEVTTGTGRCGKFPQRKRVWIHSAEYDRHRRGIDVPAGFTVAGFKRWAWAYLAWLIAKRVGPEYVGLLMVPL